MHSRRLRLIVLFSLGSVIVTCPNAGAHVICQPGVELTAFDDGDDGDHVHRTSAIRSAAVRRLLRDSFAGSNRSCRRIPLHIAARIRTIGTRLRVLCGVGVALPKRLAGRLLHHGKLRGLFAVCMLPTPRSCLPVVTLRWVPLLNVSRLKSVSAPVPTSPP